MLPAIIDYPTLDKWRKRKDGELHSEIMAGLNALITMAIRYDEAVVVNRHLEDRLSQLQRTIEVQQLDIQELRLKACDTWRCEKRK